MTNRQHVPARSATRPAAASRPAAVQAPAAARPAPAGLPRYLAARIGRQAFAAPGTRAAEAAADEFATGRPVGRRTASGATASAPASSPAQAGIRAASRALPPGRPLAPAERLPFEARLGEPLADVRLHVDPAAGALADALGANAYTLGRDIYFGRGRWRPGSVEGERLLAHELAHVVQHGAPGAEAAMHADLAMSLPVTLGAFDIDFADRVAPMRPGMEGHLGFDPAPGGPYSAEIGLVQAVRIEAGGATSGVGSGLGFGGAAEATRDVLATTGSGGEQAGWHVDTTYSDPAKTEGSQTSPSYPESVGFAPTDNEHGFLRSPTDHAPARLYDYPGSSRPQIKFDFETVARGLDNQLAYGGLHWGFEIVAGVPQAEYAYAQDATSAEFDRSLERFRAYFTHEPTVVYFDTGLDVPAAGEDAKIDEAISWLAEFPDAHVEIEGFADETGPAGFNAGLSQRRADSAAAELMRRGLDPGRIDSALGRGETDVFAAGSQAGQLKANRRARIRFVRNASTPPGL